MTRKRFVRIAGALVLAMFVTGGVFAADRAIMERLGSARGTLVAAALTGFVFFVTSVTLLEWSERRRRG